MRQVRLLLFMAVICVTARHSLAQTSQGTLAGTVTDPTGAAVVGADVTAKNTVGSDVRAAKTGSNGEYRIDAVPPSTYSITVSAPGFSRKAIENVVVTASVITSVSAQLDVGNVSETIAVEASATRIQTESGELSAAISSQEVSQLPITTGNPVDLVLTEPGIVPVASRDNVTNGEGFSVNGLRPRSNNFLIDGFDDNDYGIQGQALQPSNLDAVKEVSIQTNAYAPEFGRGGGSVTNFIYKNGTNNLHGAAWERYDASALTAIPVELKNQGITTTPQYVDNEFGFDVGGPAIRNKLFFFGSSQWNNLNENESGAQFTIPTANGVAALKSLGSNQYADLLVNSLGGLVAPSATGSINIGNRAGCGDPCLIEVGQEIRSPKGLSRSYEYVIRGDYNASEKDTFSGRFIAAHNSFTPDLFANGAALPTQDTYQGGPSRNLGFFWTHVFSPTAVNELRFTAQNISFLFGALPSTTSNPLYNTPSITIPGLDGVLFGGLSNYPQGRGHGVYQYQEAFSKIAGSHSFKMGADIVNLSENDTLFLDTKGSITVNGGGDCSAMGLTTCTALANYVDGFTGPSGQAGRQFGSTALTTPQTLQSYYFQDTWKIRQNLTLTYGIRYEYQGTPLNVLPYPTTVNSVAGLLAPITRVPEQPDYNNWGPRVGLAYTPSFWKGLLGDNKTVFRAGFGTFYDTLFTNIALNGAQTSPNLLGGVLTAPNSGRGLADAFDVVNSVTAVLTPLGLDDSVPSNLKNPESYQWNADIERQLPGNMMLTVSYVGTRGLDLFLNEELNPIVNGSRLNPDRGDLRLRSNLGNSSYNGLDVLVDRSFRNGLLFRGAYTFSKALDNGSEIFVTSGTSSFSQNLFNASQDRGPSAFDRRQRAVFTWIYDIPGFHNMSGNAKNATWLLRDWQISGVTSLQTGAPETVSLSGYDQNGDGNGGNDRPNLGNPNAVINYSPACLSNPACISGVGQINPDGSLTDWNTGAPGTASQFRYIATNVLGIGPNGNLGRNTFYNPGRIDVNLALTRSVNLPWEGHKLEFRAEAFNPFNHPNAGGGASIDGNPLEGLVPGVSGNIDSPNFMNKGVSYIGGRYVQLWLKYRF